MNMKSTLIFLLLGIILYQPCLAADFVLIVNKANPVSTLSKRDAKNIFLGKKTTWGNGESIVVAIQKAEPTSAAFTKAVVNKSSQQFLNYWRKALFTGAGILPTNLDDNAVVKKFVASEEWAISYISSASLDDTVRKVEIR